MQRVATELFSALQQHPEVAIRLLVLQTSWALTHVKTGPFLLKAMWTIRRLAKKGEIDAVVFSSMVTAALALRLRRTLAPLGIPMAAIVHGRDVTLPSAPYQWLVARIFKALDAVLPVSRATGEECLQRGLAPEKLHVVPNGVDLDRFAPLEDPAIMRQALRDRLANSEHPLPDDALLLCSVGRQVERKGFAWFIENVMPSLPDNVHYWLAGEGPESDNIKATIVKHQLEHRVRLLGRVSEEDLSALYRGADLYIMPNIPIPGDMEGFGVVMLEAGLSGRPTVAARLEGIQDVITEGANGHLVESGDAQAFSAAIMPYYHDRASLNAASIRAARHTADTFSWAAVAGRYVETIRAINKQGLSTTATT